MNKSRLHIHLLILLLLVSFVYGQQLAGLMGKVGGIAIIGNERIPEWKIKRLMRTQEPVWYKRLLGRTPDFNSRQFESDLRIIKEYYISEGFLDVEVTANAHIRTQEKNRLYLNVFIIEGPRYFLDSISLQGTFPQTIPKEQVMQIISCEIDKPINPNALQNDTRSISRYFKDRGYPYVKATSRYDVTEDSSAHVTITVEPGEKAYFGSVSYSGLTLTRESILRREVAFKKGGLFSNKKVITSKERLYRTGLFSLVSMEPIDIESSPETLNYHITVAEKRPRWIIATIGAGGNENYDLTGEATIGWGHRNLFGTGREFTIEALSEWNIIDLSNLRNRFETTYREPWSFGTRTPITLNLYFEPGNSVEIPQYKIQKIGFDISAEHSTQKRYTHKIYFNYERADIYDITDPDVRREVFGNTEPITRRIGYSCIHDNRDNLLVPTCGSYFAGAAEVAGYFLGGDEHYTKVSLGLRRYISIRSKYVFAIRGRTSVIGNWREDEDVLSHHRFYLGGASTIRGWKEKTIGPTDSNGDPRGGKLLLLGNMEFRAPIIWHLWGHIFFDSGNLWDYAEAFHPNDIKASTGWGLALVTPVGPVRFDYGYQIINADKNGDNSAWHLSLMYAF